MKIDHAPLPPAAAIVPPGRAPSCRRRLFWTGGVALALSGAFGIPLAKLMGFALDSDLYSHLPLIPVLAGYFGWGAWNENRPLLRTDPWVALAPAAAGVWLLVHPILSPASEPGDAVTEHARLTLAYVLLLVAILAGGLGRHALRSLAFPALLLLFLVPMPTRLLDAVEFFLQHGSAETAQLYFQLAGTSHFRSGLIFELPGISLRVAPECSGIHSSLALLITSLVAGKLFLRSLRWRVVLALAVVPLALLRNGLRIFVIGFLCVHLGPEMIHSWVHRQGGPLFFALSLIPFGLLLALLWRRERRNPAP